ncbi:Uncharacterised protein [Shigella sonnei]|nr:Uncharacterised protein [Shigella sonnei]
MCSRVYDAHVSALSEKRRKPSPDRAGSSHNLKMRWVKNRKNVNGYKPAILESNLPNFIQKVNIMPLRCCHPWQSCR